MLPVLSLAIHRLLLLPSLHFLSLLATTIKSLLRPTMYCNIPTRSKALLVVVHYFTSTKIFSTHQNKGGELAIVYSYGMLAVVAFQSKDSAESSLAAGKSLFHLHSLSDLLRGPIVHLQSVSLLFILQPGGDCLATETLAPCQNDTASLKSVVKEMGQI